MKKSLIIILFFSNLVYSTTSEKSNINDSKKLYLKAKKHLKNKQLLDAYNTFIDSSKLNHPKANTMLGKFFLLGKVVEVDYETALYYFKKASKLKDYNANCYISYMYASGKGVFPNFGRAHIFAKNEYKKGNKLCIKVWKDYNLGKYKKDEGWKIGDYLKPLR